ncbi:hypothetical protein HZY91_01100 [Facklamia sp. DSM 111018]|uniref:RNA-binding protein n=1 Tax=Facklamia lactis TaxID=2749967 RepID=A0ABS0LNE6_9LACT|nr:hypothetical protein [Facklamia lactis]MBG9985487.1 hypothetical protein [Facklamia lactis]
MVQYGEIITAKITDENATHYFVQKNGQTFALAKDQTDGEHYQLEEEIEGLIYEDMDHRPVIQINLPDIRPGFFGWGTITQVRKDLGVFVDIGLYNKDIVVSLDDLPDDRSHWPQKADCLYLTIMVDQKNRFWGQIANYEEIAKLFKPAPQRLMNQDVEARIFQLKLAGAQLITKEGYRAFVHESEWILPPRLGQKVQARVTKVHPDGSLNLSLKPRAHEAIEDDATMLLRLLDKSPNHFLPLHDKSDPEVIKSYLGISKGQFKRAVGSLLKDKKIRQEKEKGLYLIDKDDLSETR